MPFREPFRSVSSRLICLLVVGHLAFSGGRFILMLQAVALNASPLAIGILMSLLMVVPMVLSIHMGRWSDRLGFGWPAAAGLGTLALASLLAGAAPTMLVLYVASVFIGSGYTLAHVAVNNAIGQLAPARQLTRAFSILALGFSFSGMAGPFIAGLLIDHLGHPAAFFSMVAIAVVSLALLAPLMRESRPAATFEAAADSSSLAELLRIAPLRDVLIVSGLLAMAWDMFVFLAPLHGARVGLSATSNGMLLGVFGAGTFAIRLLLPLVASRMTEWRVLSWALLMAALCYVLFPFAATLPLMLAAAFAMGLSVGGGQPMAMALLHLTAPPSRAGEAVGIRTCMVSASQTVFPLVFGAVGAALGIGSVFWAGATVLASGGAFARRLGQPATSRL